MSPARMDVEEDMVESEKKMWMSSKKEKPLHVEEISLDNNELKQLWETEWKSACQNNQSPFQDAHYPDVATLITTLLSQGITSPTSPAFTTAFTTAAALLAEQSTTLPSPTAAEAGRLLLRATALCRIAGATTQQHALYRRATALLWPSHSSSPLDEVRIPNLHPETTTSSSSPRQNNIIPLAVRIPQETLCTGAPCPALVLLTADWTGCTALLDAALERGWGCVVVDEDGGEPGVRKSVLAWMAAVGFWDMQRVVGWKVDGGGLVLDGWGV